MPIEGFDYQNFAQVLSSQAGELLPADFTDFQRNYVVNTLNNFATLAGEALYNDSTVKFSADQAMLVTQIIAEWSFHKSVDLIKSGIANEYWDGVMQKIAFTIFEIAKQTISQDLPQDQVLQIVEHHVQKTYSEALEELKSQGSIDSALLDKAAHQSNIDEMMDQIQKDKEAYASTESSSATEDSKILKLASVALLLKQLPTAKVRSILDKFGPIDAQHVMQYMNMSDLEDKVDKDIAIKCLNEIKTSLPSPRKVSANVILSKFNKIVTEKGKAKVDSALVSERANVKKFIKEASEGECSQLPSKVANIIVKHLEESI